MGPANGARMDDQRPRWAIRLQAEREARGWSKRETARQLYRAAGIRNGNVASLSRQIAWHESGEHVPRQWAPAYAAVYGIREDALFGDALARLERLDAHGDLSASLGELCRSDLISDVGGRVWSTGDAFLDELELLLVVSNRAPVLVSSVSGVSLEHVWQVEAATAVFRGWDNQFGGGLRRKAVVGQLSEVLGLLKGPFAEPGVGQRLFAAVADLTQLAGFMSFDVRLHGAAQRYFTLGLRLAKESGDRLQAARMLYCLARQMIELDEPQTALDLAQSGLYLIRRARNARVSAMMHAMEGRAHGCMGDSRGCQRALDESREEFDRAETADDPPWAAFFSDSELLGVTGVALRDLSLWHLRADQAQLAHTYATKARPFIAQAAEGRSKEYLRSQVLDLDGLAVVNFLAGEPGEAVRAAHRALDLSAPVSSARTQRNLQRTIRLGRARYGDLPELRELSQRAQSNPSVDMERQ
jgi:hypothetical protein